MTQELSKKEQIFGVRNKTTQVYDPSGRVIPEKIDSFPARPKSLNGKRIGLLWNSKPNGDHFLNRVAELISKRFTDSTIIKLWEVFPESSNPDKKSEEALSYIALNTDVVIAAHGD